MWAPVVELFLFPWPTEFGLKILTQLRILLKGREGMGGLHKNHACALTSL